MAMNDSEKARIAGRKEAVKAGAAKGLSGKESRKRYYVRTRVAELEKAGKGPVSAEKRKQLREKFNSGNISRKGFAAPKKKTGGSGSSGSSSGSSGSSSGSSGSGSGSSGSTIITQSGGRSARDNMKGVSGYKAGSTKASSKVSKVAKKKNSGGFLGALKGAAGKVDRFAGKVGNFANNELLGFDDIQRYDKYMGSGEYGKAAKSLGAGLGEMGSTIASAGVGAVAAGGSKGVVASTKGGLAAIKAAKAAKLAKANRVGAIGKSPVRSLLVSGAKTGAKKSVAKVAPKVAKRVPKVAKTLSKPLTKSGSKSLTSKAVVKSAKKPLVSKASKATTRKPVGPRNYSKSTGKPFNAKQEAAFKKEYARVNKNANAARKRAANAKYMTGTSK